MDRNAKSGEDIGKDERLASIELTVSQRYQEQRPQLTAIRYRKPPT